MRRLRLPLLLATAALVASACAPALVPSIPLPLAGASSQLDDFPVGAQDGTVKIPLKCNLPILGDQTFIVNLTGIAGTSYGPGQQFYVTGGHGSLEVPASVTGWGSLLGATSATAQITQLDLNATNATPSTFNMAATPIDVPTVPIVKDQPSKVVVPQTGELTVGPFTAGPNGVIEMSMGAAKAKMTLKNATGGTVLFPLDVTCSAPTPKVVLVGITIGGPAGQPVSKYTAPRVPDADLPTGWVMGSLKVGLTCSVSGYGTSTINATLTGALPAVLPQSHPYYFQDAKGILELPAPLVNQFISSRGAAKVSGAIDQLDINAQNSTPAVLNAASPPIAVPPVSLQSGKAVQLTLPQTGSLQVGPFTPGSAGNTMLTWGRSGGTLNLLDANGATLGAALTVACQPPSPTVILLLEQITTGAAPSVNQLSATSGPAAGGASVKLTGSGFNNASAVNFGYAQAAFKVNSDSEITVTVPPHTPGLVDVTVLGPAGPSPYAINDQYRFT